MSEKKSLPKFEDEAAEARWWDEHQEEILEYGTVMPAPDPDPEIEALKAAARGRGRPRSDVPSRQVHFRMADQMIDRVKDVAHRKGVRYQTLMKSWIFRALTDEESKAQ